MIEKHSINDAFGFFRILEDHLDIVDVQYKDENAEFPILVAGRSETA